MNLVRLGTFLTAAPECTGYIRSQKKGDTFLVSDYLSQEGVAGSSFVSGYPI